MITRAYYPFESRSKIILLHPSNRLINRPHKFCTSPEPTMIAPSVPRDITAACAAILSGRGARAIARLAQVGVLQTAIPAGYARPLVQRQSVERLRGATISLAEWERAQEKRTAPD